MKTERFSCPRNISPNICSFHKILQLFVLVSIITVVSTIYYLINTQNLARYVGRHPFNPAMKCRNLTKPQMDQLLNLSYKVHHVLDELGVEHWLMYGSLLGALRGNAPLAWDDDVDIGLDGDGRLKTLSKTTFVEKLNSVGVKRLDYFWSRDGLIKIFDGNSEFTIDLMVFTRSGKWMKRPGWVTWLLYFQYNKFHTFPAELIQQPLPKIQFGFFNISAPRGGKEILKYIYPTDWWKVVKPPGC